MRTNVQQYQQARVECQWRWSQLVGLHDTESRAHQDRLWDALLQFDELIRDERRAVEVQAQKLIAPASSKGGSQMQPIKGPGQRKGRAA
jgi:hypothetical protein